MEQQIVVDEQEQHQESAGPSCWGITEEHTTKGWLFREKNAPAMMRIVPP